MMMMMMMCAGDGELKLSYVRGAIQTARTVLSLPGTVILCHSNRYVRRRTETIMFPTMDYIPFKTSVSKNLIIGCVICGIG